jgi:hypothetical protein
MNERLVDARGEIVLRVTPKHSRRCSVSTHRRSVANLSRTVRPNSARNVPRSAVEIEVFANEVSRKAVSGSVRI